MDFFKRALELKEETLKSRRYLHENAEVGLNMPIGKKFIFQKLAEYGIKAKECGHGICATVGKGLPCLLLRADMDALPMREESGESFASKNANAAHTCGHDMHAAMLLTSAKMLKENEELLRGTVKFMFQPAEEILAGAKDMIDHGILKDPRPNAALALHTAAGKVTPDTFMYNSGGVMMYSANGIRITVKGKGGHAAYPGLAEDPIETAFRIYKEISAIVQKEEDAILTIGKIQSGSAANIIPDTAVMEGTLRSRGEEKHERIYKSICKAARDIAEESGCRAQITPLFAAPALICDKALTDLTVSFIKKMNCPLNKAIPDMSAAASEDFAYIAREIPSVFLYLGAGFSDERGDFTAHHPKVVFNEDVLPLGSAVLAHCTVRFLEEQAKQ